MVKRGGFDPYIKAIPLLKATIFACFPPCFASRHNNARVLLSPHSLLKSHDSQIVYWFVYSLACIDVFFCFGLFSVNSHEMQIREVFSCHGLYAGLSSSIPFK